MSSKFRRVDYLIKDSSSIKIEDAISFVKEILNTNESTHPEFEWFAHLTDHRDKTMWLIYSNETALQNGMSKTEYLIIDHGHIVDQVIEKIGQSEQDLSQYATLDDVKSMLAQAQLEASQSPNLDFDSNSVIDIDNALIVDPQNEISKIESRISEGYFGMNQETGEWLNGIQHLSQSIKRIISTAIGSLVSNREFGSGISEIVGIPVTEDTRVDIFYAIADSLDKWEPRFKLESCKLNESSNINSGLFVFDLVGIYILSGRAINFEGLEL